MEEKVQFSDWAKYEAIEHNTYLWWMWMFCSDICKVIMFPTAFNKLEWMSMNGRIFASSRRSIRPVLGSVLDRNDCISLIKYVLCNESCLFLTVLKKTFSFIYIFESPKVYNVTSQYALGLGYKIIINFKSVVEKVLKKCTSR